MVTKTVFSMKLVMSLFMAVLFTAALVTAGCTSSDKTEKKEDGAVTESVEKEVKEAPPEEGAESAPAENKRQTGPPQELVDACKDLNEGADCTILLSGGTEHPGSCRKIRTGDIACMPKPIPRKVTTPDRESAGDTDQEAGEGN